MDPVLGGAIFAVAVVIGVAAMLWAYRRAKLWREIVLAVAQRYRMQCFAPTGIGMGGSSAYGTYEEVDLNLDIEERSHGTGDRNTTERFLRLKANGSGGDGLVLHGRDQPDPAKHADIMDFSEGAREAGATPIGDPAFDTQFALMGASPRLVEALRTGDLRRRIMNLSAWGLSINGAAIQLRTRRFPGSAQEMFSLVDDVVAVAHEVATLQR